MSSNVAHISPPLGQVSPAPDKPSGAAGLRARRDTLEAFWQQGIGGTELLRRHTEFVDYHIAANFTGCPEAGDGFALIALGGYGRRELFPFSDIDLMLLYEPRAAACLDRVAETILYPLWDSGLEVGHAVRTVEECLSHAEEDFFFQVAMLDARLLAGSESLFADLTARFMESFIEGRRREFVRDMLLHRARRQQQFGGHTYLLEPHIKEGRGGFRDIQAMLWTALAVFGLKGLSGLREAGLLTPAEVEQFEQARDFLVRVRNRLHYVCGRKNDQLFFEHQEEIARAFGFANRDDRLAVEHFMRQLYGHLRTVAVTTELFFEHVDEVLTGDRPAHPDRLLEPGIEVRHDRIHLVDPEMLAHKPGLVMRLFLQSARTAIPLHHRTRRIIRDNLHLATDRMRHSRRLAANFLALLTEAAEPLPVLTAMLETGFLTAYLPEFAPVESLAQHDLYHVHTVDRHLLQTVAELHQLRHDEPHIFGAVNRPRLLFLAALVHDLGKGFGHGHAERGADLARTIASRMALDEDESACLDFLVRQHLFLFHTALRRDLEDEEFIWRCARLMQSSEWLAMLYLLTVADARATGPTVWNDWKAALLLELYLKIALLLESKELTAGEQARSKALGAQWTRDKVAALLPAGTAANLEILPEDYLLHYGPEVIAGHIGHTAELAGRDVLFYHEKHDESWSLLIITRDRPGLLARVFGVLSLHNLKILAAQIFTWGDGTVVDTIEVSSAVDEAYEEQDWDLLAAEINQAVNQRLGLAHRLTRKPAPSGRNGRRRAGRRLTDKVEIDNLASEKYTVIEVYAHDRIGLLYDITRILSEFGLSIYRARIGSRADQAVDVFYVLDYDGRKIEAKTVQEEISKELLHAVAPTGDR